MPRIFETFRDKIPTIYKRIDHDALDALVAKADEHIEDWEDDVVQLIWLLDPARCPSKLLNTLGEFLNAGILADDDDATKRKKIGTAVESHKRRGSFVFDAKPKIDAIAGGDSSIFQIIGTDEWIIVGDGLTPTAFYWAALGVDNVDLDLGITISGREENDLTLAGNIAIDVDNSGLTADEVEQIKLELADVAPAYYRVLLGYVVAGSFIIYANGIIE